MITPGDVTVDMLNAADDYIRANTAYPYTEIDPYVKFCAIVNAAIDAGIVFRRIPDADDPRVLRRALRLAIFALYDEKLYVPTAADPQNYIDQARRELESEGSDET